MGSDENPVCKSHLSCLFDLKHLIKDICCIFNPLVFFRISKLETLYVDKILNIFIIHTWCPKKPLNLEDKTIFLETI